MRGQMNMIVGLIGLVIFVIIALNLAPTVANQSEFTALNPNTTAAGSSLARLTPLLYLVVIVVAILGFMSFKRD